MARYEKPDEQSGKYWEIDLKGLTIVTRSGKIGLGPASEWQGRMHFSERRGRTTTRELPDVASAEKEMKKLVTAKLREGFKLVDPGLATATAGDVVCVTNADLEARIAAALDDTEPYTIYADWLQANGDPRGELVAMQLGMRDHTDPAQFMRFKKHEEQLRTTYAHLWLGAGVAASAYRLKLEWKCGFIAGARVDEARYPGELATGALLANLFTSPCGRMLRTLTLRGGREISEDFPDTVPRTLKKVRLRVREPQLFVLFRTALEAKGLVVEIGSFDAP